MVVGLILGLLIFIFGAFWFSSTEEAMAFVPIIAGGFLFVYSLL